MSFNLHFNKLKGRPKDASLETQSGTGEGSKTPKKQKRDRLTKNTKKQKNSKILKNS